MADEFDEGTLSGGASIAHSAQAKADESIANALDALNSLNADEAEHVFHRALELEAESLEQPHVFSTEQLEAIADEINMDVSFVRQALGEVRLAPAEAGWLDSKILPEAIIAIETFDDIARSDLDSMIDDWMTGHEGLITASNLEDGKHWDVDRRWSSRFRAQQLAGGNRISRTAGGDVAHRVHSLSSDEHVVAMHSEGAGPLLVAKLGLAAAALILGYGAVSNLGLSPTEFLQSLASLAVVAAGTAATSIFLARRWARGIGRALTRSLTGLAERVRGKRGPRAPIDLKPIVTELLQDLTRRVKAHAAQRYANRSTGASGASAVGARRSRPPPPRPETNSWRRPTPPPPRRGARSRKRMPPPPSR